jgi:hypothetical protein
MTDRINMKKHEAAVDACLAKLKAFLMTPDHGDGDWPNIPREVLTTADDLVGEMLDLKWGRDVDGDAPVKVRMWHRGQLRLVCDWAFIDTGPRGEESEAAQEARCLRNLSTVSAVSAACADELRRLHVEMADAHNRKLRHQAAFEVVVVTYAPTAERARGARMRRSACISTRTRRSPSSTKTNAHRAALSLSADTACSRYLRTTKDPKTALPRIAPGSKRSAGRWCRATLPCSR